VDGGGGLGKATAKTRVTPAANVQRAAELPPFCWSDELSLLGVLPERDSWAMPSVVEVKSLYLDIAG
jgi:hypothetical protein